MELTELGLPLSKSAALPKSPSLESDGALK